MLDGRLVLEELTPSQCLGLIAAGGLGRVGINVEALPVILPVDFALLDDDIVVRTVPGTKLNAALAGAVVAFQTDFSDMSTGDAWSVLVRGVAQELTTNDDLREAHQLGLRSWSDDGSDDRFVRIESRIVTGRRLRSAL
jgi:nitroimidazol reductase NimA-like FMN-containing flavoprotein (pyridoxamine 5'-phosphate oxidase superfamily)